MRQTNVLKRTTRGCKPKPTDVLFANDQWVVTGEGLENADHGYFIGADRLGALQDGLLEWPLRMIQKRWVKPDSFLQAFAVGCRVHGIPVDNDLRARTWAVVRREAIQNKQYKKLWRVAAAELYPANVAKKVVEGLVSPTQLLQICDEIDRMIYAGGQHSRCGPA